jgi:cobalt-zinc-cadmium efflux system protein
MGHNHDHNHERQGNIKIAFFLNLAFTILEIVGGIWTNSLAILSDALHDLGDSFSLGVAWYLEKFSSKGPDKKFSFGYARFSLLGALINSLILVGGSVLILSRSIPRILNPEQVNPKGMLAFAIVGVVINGIAVLRLRKGSSLNEKVVSWHLLEDVFGWVAVLIASIVLLFVDIPIIDPILSILITFYVLYNVFKNLKKILNVFLQGVPGDYSIEEIEKEIVKITGAKAAYHTHVWSLDGERHLLTVHVILSDDIERKQIIETKQIIRDHIADMGIEHVTIEIDFECEETRDEDF